VSRKCKRCDYDITVSYLLKQKSFSVVPCENCGRLMRSTKMSKVLTLSYYILIAIVFIILPIKIIKIVFLEYIWLIISYYFLPAILYMYEVQDNNKNRQ